MSSNRVLQRYHTMDGAGKLFNFRPVFFCALALSVGIIFAYLVLFCDVSARWLFCLLPIAATPLVFWKNRNKLKRAFVATLAVVVFFAAGYTGFQIQVVQFNDVGRYQGEVTVNGRVIEKSQHGDSLRVVLDSVMVGSVKEKGKLVAYLPVSFSDKFILSDEITLRGRIRNQMLTDENGEFYSTFLTKDERLAMYAYSYAVTGHKASLFLAVRNRIEEVAYACMDKETAAFTIAVLTGNTSGIETETLENVRFGGVAHIFAVSGLHVGAVFAFCLWLASTLLERFPKWGQFLFTVAVLLFYGGVCGFSASVIRATVMCLLLYFSKLSGISSDSTERLAAAHALVLLLSPSSLFTLGFQLSFAACYGIVWLAPPLYKQMQSVCELFYPPRKSKKGDSLPLNVPERIRRAIISFLSVTIAAQAFTAPISIIAFGYFSWISLVLNCLFVPLISAAFALLLALVLLSCILPLVCGSIILYAPNAVLSVLLLLFQLTDFSKLKLVCELGLATCLTWYTFLILCTDKWNLSRKELLVGRIAMFLAFAATVYATNM